MHEEFSSVVLNTKKLSHEGPNKGPHHHALDAFVGLWNVDGQNGAAAPDAASDFINGVETYEWLDGEYFLIYRWDRTFSSGHHKGFGVIGFDGTINAYYAQFYDNMGLAQRYAVRVSDGEMKLEGETEKALIAVSRDRNALSVHWEIRGKEGSWSTLCNLAGHRTH